MSDMNAMHPETVAILNAQRAADKDPTLSPETGKPFSKAVTARFFVAFTLYGILNNIAFGINGTTLLPQHITDVKIANPEMAFATITSITSMFSLVIALIWGALSDRTRSRFGRRTPWIFIGSFVSGFGLFLLGHMSTTASLTLAYCLNNMGQNALQTPMYALLADRCPQESRGTLSSGFGATVIGAPIGTIIGSQFLGQSYQAWGFVVGALFMVISGLIPLAIMPREPSSRHYPKLSGTESGIVREILGAIRPPRFAIAHDFYKALAGRFFMLMSYQMIMQYQLYIMERYIGLSVRQAGAAMVTLSTITLVVSVIGTFFSGPVSDRIGRRKPPIIIASVLFAVGTAMPWLMPSVTGMYLYVGIAGFGYGIYMAVDQALNVDVMPDKENSGKYLGFLNLATTFGFTLAPMITSSIVSVTGSYAVSFPISMAGSLIGAAFIAWIKGVK